MIRKFQPIFSFAKNIPLGYDGDGGAGDGGAAGDKGEFSLEKVNELVNRTVNNAIANLKKSDLPKIISAQIEPVNTQLASINDSLKLLIPPPNGGGAGDGHGGAGSGGSGGSGQNVPPEINAELRKLNSTLADQKKQIDDLAKAKADADSRAERAERDSTIKEAIGSLPFATETAAATAFTLVLPHVKRTEDGVLIAGDNLPIADFAKEFLTKDHAYLFRATGSSGAGAQSGNGMPRGAGQFDTDKIKPGMSAEERAQAYAALRAAYPGAK